jgi:molecular chaperone GrpE
MTNVDEKLEEEILESELQDLENAQNAQEDTNTTRDDNATDEVAKLKEQLARTQADYANFKMRSERDRQDMIFFLKYDIFKKILPRIDDLERMIKNTPEDQRSGALYEAILAQEKAFKKDLENL